MRFLKNTNIALVPTWSSEPKSTKRIKIEISEKQRKLNLAQPDMSVFAFSSVLHSSRPQPSFDAIDFYGIEEILDFFEKNLL